MMNERNLKSALTMEDAKAYLRVDDSFPDEKIAGPLAEANEICFKETKLSEDDWNAIVSYDGSDEIPTMHGKVMSEERILDAKNLIRISVMRSLDVVLSGGEVESMHDLLLTLRCILFTVRVESMDETPEVSA